MALSISRRSSRRSRPHLCRRRQGLTPLPCAEKLLALRRSAAEQLEPLVEELAPAQAAKLVIADYNRKRRELLKSGKAELDEEMSALASGRCHAMAARRKALDLLAASDPLFAPVFLTVKPFLIWASPSNMLVDSHIDALGHSWAKLSFSHELDWGHTGFPGVPFDPAWVSRLTFYYLWENRARSTSSSTRSAPWYSMDSVKSMLTLELFMEPLPAWVVLQS